MVDMVGAVIWFCVLLLLLFSVLGVAGGSHGTGAVTFLCQAWRVNFGLESDFAR